MSNRNPYIIVFSSGHVVDVKPMPVGDIYDNRDIIYSADNIISDGVQYDLTDRASIYSIAIPAYDLSTKSPIVQKLGVTGCLDYVLRMKAGQYWNEGQYGLSTTCLGKATKMMLFSDVGWPKKDYYRIVNELVDLGRLKKAEEWKEWINANVPNDLPQDDVGADLAELQDECNLMDTDLVEVGDIGGCCPKCAKYRKRIYSLNGKDRRFPRFPSDFHTNCGLCAGFYCYGDLRPSFQCKDIIKYSNRPFVDDRSQEEKETYQKRLNMIQMNPIYEPNPARTSYYLIKKYFPDLAPKSMSGYMRMYNAKSKNYLKLIDTVTAEGLRLPKTVADLYELEETKEFERV